VCPAHLQDKHFCSPIIDTEGQAARAKEEAMVKEIEMVKKEYEEKQRRKKEREKESTREDKEDKVKSKDESKDKDKSKNSNTNDEKERDERVRTCKCCMIVLADSLEDCFYSGRCWNREENE
jgi:chemotaxis response regulator CheB